MSDPDDIERAQRRLENRCSTCGRDLMVKLQGMAGRTECPECKERMHKSMIKAMRELDAEREDRFIILGKHTAKWFTK